MPSVGFAFTDSALDFLAGLPPKVRRQVIKKANALQTNPHSPTSKKLQDVRTPQGDPVYRERSGDYRILYVVRPEEVLILDIDHRKDVYRMPKTNPTPADETRIRQGDFDDISRGVLGVTRPAEKPKANDAYPEKRLSAYPTKQRQT